MDDLLLTWINHPSLALMVKPPVFLCHRKVVRIGEHGERLADRRPVRYLARNKDVGHCSVGEVGDDVEPLVGPQPYRPTRR